MINCIAIDDEPLALNLLADNISKIPYLHLVATCEDAFAAAKAIEEYSIDLIFIDIQMPGLTGLQFIESMSQKPMVIIVTAYKQFALDGYHLDVVDYLMKPVPLERFMKACNKAKELFDLRNKNNQPGIAHNYMFVNVGYSLLKIMFDDIVFIEGLKDYVQIHLKSTPKPVLVRASIKAMEDQLPPALFARVHKSYILSIQNITALRKNSIFVGDKEFPVGETYRNVIDKLTK
jgi:Response regulator of the LytR/AlgR family